MKDERKPERKEAKGSGICANEGCGRPAEGRWCEVCALEWSLFHRERRADEMRAPSNAR